MDSLARVLRRLDLCTDRSRADVLFTFVCVMSAIVVLIGVSSPVQATTTTELDAWFGGVVPPIMPLLNSNTLQYVTRIENLTVVTYDEQAQKNIETIYDVDFKRGYWNTVFGYDLESDTFLDGVSPPEFWGDEETAQKAAMTVMEALGGDKRTYGNKDTFAVFFGVTDSGCKLLWYDMDNWSLADDTLVHEVLCSSGYIFAVFSKPPLEQIAARLGYQPPSPTPEPPIQIPESSTLFLLGIGLVGLAIWGKNVFKIRSRRQSVR